MSDSKIREEFEKFQIETGRTDPLWFENAWFSERENKYALNDVNDDWEKWQVAWKAYRESLVIDIEEPSIRGMTSEQHMGAMIACERIRESIHAAGVKTK